MVFIDISLVSPLILGTFKIAYELRKNLNVSFWDSNIIASAIENDCRILYSEDFQHNQLIDKTLRIINPFIA